MDRKNSYQISVLKGVLRKILESPVQSDKTQKQPITKSK